MKHPRKYSKKPSDMNSNDISHDRVTSMTVLNLAVLSRYNACHRVSIKVILLLGLGSTSYHSVGSLAACDVRLWIFAHASGTHIFYANSIEPSRYK